MAEKFTTVESLQQALKQSQDQLDKEKKRSFAYVEEIRKLKEQNLSAQNSMEQEEEAITNKLMKRLSQLKMEKQALANEVEQEEEFLTNNLQKRLQQLNNEKTGLEKQLEAEQEYIVNKLQKQLDDLVRERSKLTQEKVDLENQLEVEQEYIVNKLQKQVSALAVEKKDLKKERDELKHQVLDLGADKIRLHSEKIAMENQLEAEEENIVNRLTKQLEELAYRYMILERQYDKSATQTSESETEVSEDEGSFRGRRWYDLRYASSRSVSTHIPRTRNTNLTSSTLKIGEMPTQQVKAKALSPSISPRDVHRGVPSVVSSSPSVSPSRSHVGISPCKSNT